MVWFARYCIRWVAAILAIGAFTLRCPAATPDQIDAALAKAQKFLLSQQLAGGHWETDGSRKGNREDAGPMRGATWGGYTALCTYALLASGVSTNDPHIQQAVAFLKKADIVGTYAMGLRLQVWLLMWRASAPAQRAEYAALASADADKLLQWVYTNGPYQGLWTYISPDAVIDPPDPAYRLKWDHIDHSASQYGILGLWAGAQMGAEIPSRYWEGFDRVWRRDQFPDGGWAYGETPAIPGANPTHVSAAMTAAGIASLFIIQQYTQAGKIVGCNGNIPNANIDKGLDWMSRHLAEANDPYTFYGIERIGVASGYKYFGTVDWFATIADRLIGSQAGDGSFGQALGQFNGATPLTDTAFGVLFLARGGAPVMINKLKYSITVKNQLRQANWNERPRDVFNLAQWSGEQSEADLNFQVVTLDVSVRDLHDAPILCLTGNQYLNLADADIAKLREFVTEGGLILGNADCSSEAFKNSFIDLGHKLFPKYAFAQIEKDNLIFQEAHAKFRGTPKLLGLSNGVRQLMLLFPTGDPSRAWQTKAMFGNHRDEFQLGFNIFLYAVDTKGLRKKGESYLVDPDPKIQPTKSIKVARLMVGANPDPEPGGWPRLAAILHNQPHQLDVQVADVMPDESLAGCQIVDITGTTAFKLTDAERAALLECTRHGGTLIIDAAGGSGAFADSAEAELAKIFGNAATAGLARPLPPECPVYHLPNANLNSVSYRMFAQKVQVGRIDTPHLRGIEVNGRIVAFYSREDLSAGLVGEPVDGIFGYSPQSATDLMRNLVLYAAK